MNISPPAGLPLLISQEIADAIAEKRAIVALESTIITHGMPYPDNLATAVAVESVVRAEGAVPATIALLDGTIRVGLDRDLERLAQGRDVAKASSRDLAALIVKKKSGGTTVSATMRIAALAGIKLFATGGVGGVHRGAEATFDISADLVELGSTATAVVCAGVKSILDIPKTLEFLETQRVPVFGFGTDEFPAFYTRTSGEKLEHRFDSAAELAAAILVHDRLGSGTGIMIANPIPADKALDASAIEKKIAAAVRDAEARGVERKELTPFLLARINELSGGESLTANIALVRNNAAVAARIALEIETLSR